MSMQPLRRSPRLLAGLALVLVAAAGALAGVAADRTVRASPAPMMAADSGERCPDRAAHRDGKGYRERLAESLDLTPEQRERIDAILEHRQEQMDGLTKEMRPRMREIMRETGREITAELTPEQQERLRELHREARSGHDHSETRRRPGS